MLDFLKTVSGIPGETLYHTDLGETITGTNPFTGKVDTISHITDLLLYNNNVADIQFNDDSAVTMTIIFRYIASNSFTHIQQFFPMQS
jgi:hypothetical protein